MGISIVLIFFLSKSLTIGGTRLPALGHFLNPFTGFWNQASSGKAGSQETYFSSFLVDSVRVEFDRRMVPHIYASDNLSAFYAQGFLHASNRLFQMEITARAISGRLSELLGKATLSRDIFARRIHFSKIVEDKYKIWSRDPDMMAVAEAYVRGVNDYIRQLKPKNYPIEYKLLNASPEEWSVRKSIAVSVSLAATLNLNLQDFERTNTLWTLGPEIYDHLFPLYPDSILPIDIDRSSYPDSVPVHEPQQYGDFDYLKTQFPADPGPGIGSNNWAVRAAITRDSIPILANDPHLRLTLPNIWYELQIHSPDFNTHGVSVPGMPAIVIGFNDRMAWGLTNASIDVLDAYKIKWQDQSAGTYLLDGDTRQAELREEIIHIKGEPDHIETVWDTHWGPVLYKGDLQANQNIAVKWMSALPGDECDLRMLYDLMQARGISDYREAISHFYAPAQNIAFASVDDSIAITVQGKLPIKRPGQGRFILDGSLSANDWQGIIPNSHLPRMINPDRNYILSANEWSTYPDYPYFYTGKFDHYRGRAIAMYLDSLQPLTVNCMKDIQTSTYNLKAAEIIPELLSFLTDQSPGRQWRDSLHRWNYFYEPESVLATLSELWLNEAIQQVFDEIKMADSVALMYPQIWRLGELLQQPDDPIFDRQSTSGISERASDVIQSSWEAALERFEGMPEDDRAWGKRAGLSIDHLLGIPEFSRRNLMTGGNGNTINAITTTNGPSWRMIVELARDSVTAQVIYPGGQSGNPGSQYYDNFIDDWLDGNYYEVRLESDPNDINESIHYSLYMLPQ